MSEIDKSALEPTIKAGDLVYFESDSYCGIIYKVIKVVEVPYRPYRSMEKYELINDFETRIANEKIESARRWGREFEVVYAPVFTLFKQEFSKTRKRVTGNGNTDFGMRKINCDDLTNQVRILRQFIEKEFLYS